jgi:hypothetical protein
MLFLLRLMTRKYWFQSPTGSALMLRTPRPWSPPLRPLDLDHLGAEVGEVLRRDRPLEPDRQVDDADALERAPRQRSSPSPERR